MSLMSRKFTLRETILMLVLAVALLGVFYYFVVFDPLQNQIVTCNAAQTAAEDESMIEQARASQKQAMLTELEGMDKTIQGEIVPYNNVKNEINELYAILAGSSAYNLSFSEATCRGTTVRRDISVTFQAPSFRAAVDIIKQMQNSSYRCIVKDMNLSAGTRANSRNTSNAVGLQTSDVVSAGLTITFYETTVGATDLSGLVMDKTQATNNNQPGDSNLGDLATLKQQQTANQ